MTDSTNDHSSFESYEPTDAELARDVAAVMDEAFFGPMEFAFTAAEVELLQDCVAGELARALVSSAPVSLNRFQALTDLGQRLGMEL